MKELELSQGFKTYVDDEDYDHLNQWKWYYHKGRAVRGQWHKCPVCVREKIYMARYLMKCPPHLFVDHIDGNPLNNTKRNLRICTKAQNCQNRKKRNSSPYKYKGAYFYDGKWVSSIGYKNKSIFIGRFNNDIDAAIAYNKKAIELFGEFAKLNDIPGENVGLGGLASASG